MTGKQLIESQIGVALGMRRAGSSQRQIAAELGVQQSTISRLFVRHTTTQFKKRGPRRQYKRATTQRDDRYLARVALKFRRMSLQAITNDTGLNISKTTVQRRLKELGINKRVARTKPHLTPQHMAARLEWALEHENWTVEQWANVIWSDESSIQIGFDPRQTMVFRRPGEAFLSECLRPSFKSKRVSLMVWGCFRWNKLGPLIVCGPGGIGSDEYLEVLAEGLLSFKDDILGAVDEDTIIVRNPDDLIFMQDGAPCHRTADVKQFLAEEESKVMSWPAQSPDLNPIENVWQMLKIKFHERFTHLRCSLSKSQASIDKYGAILQEVWEELSPTMISNLIRSMPGRMKAVIEAKGGAIRF